MTQKVEVTIHDKKLNQSFFHSYRFYDTAVACRDLLFKLLPLTIPPRINNAP